MHLLLFPLLLEAAQALFVPPPPGPYNVAVEPVELVDPSRIDPFAPEANATRRFMASAYLPVDASYGCKAQVVPYMPPLTASVYSSVAESLGLPQGIIQAFKMEVCNISTVNLEMRQREKEKEFPVAVFSPGFGGTRLAYGALARSVSSLGYIVITVDPTYEAAVVEFPDGTAAYAQPSAASNQTLTPRELELSNTTFTNVLFANFPGTFNSLKVAAYGHSFGGSTAAEAALRDSRVVGGLNIDGPLYGSVGEQGIAGKPFVLVANGGESVVNFTDFYGMINAPKMDLVVKDTQHYAFTDVPLLLTVYQVPPASQPMVHQVFGTLNGKKVERAVDQVTTGLLEFLFYNQTKSLENMMARNPNIDVIHSEI